MKNNSFRTFRQRVLAYTIISGAITCGVELFFVLNLGIIVDFLRTNGYRNSVLGRDGLNPSFRFVLIILIAVIVFSASFIVLIERHINYIKRISRDIQKIADGDLNTTIQVLGHDEFASIAANLNKMTEEIKVLIERERESERSKNDLITNVAHDLRTPLTSIIGYLELLNLKPDLDEEVRIKYVGIAYSKSKRLEKLIEDLFGFTKLSHGKLPMKTARLNIVKLLDQLLDEFYPSFQNNNLEYEFKSSSPGIFIEADGDLLARLFENLFSNAVKYGADGKLILVEVAQEENMVKVDVTNYGKVIPQNELAYVFQKFYRVEQSRSENTGGTGLGLAIAKSVVEMHGGTIHVRSSLKGTVFEVRLYVSLEDHREKFSVEAYVEKE